MPLRGPPGPLTLEDELEDACLDEAHWDDYVDVMTNPLSSQADKDRYDCWMTHYIEHCNRCSCTHFSECPGPDPFDD